MNLRMEVIDVGGDPPEAVLRYNEERVLLETSILDSNDPTGPSLHCRLIDGPRPMGRGWQLRRGDEWVPWTPSAVDAACIAMKISNALAQAQADRESEATKLRQLLQDEKVNLASERARNLGLEEQVSALRDEVSTLNEMRDVEDDGDRLLSLRSLVAVVERTVDLLTIVEGWPDLGFLRYARADLTAALHHARGQL